MNKEEIMKKTIEKMRPYVKGGLITSVFERYFEELSDYIDALEVRDKNDKS